MYAKLATMTCLSRCQVGVNTPNSKAEPRFFSAINFECGGQGGLHERSPTEKSPKF